MLKYPEFIEEKIGNTSLFLTPLKRHSTAIQLSFEVGSFLEDKEQAGISHFLEHLIFNGSKKYPSFLKMSRAVEKFGGIINGFTAENQTAFWIFTPASALDKTLDILFDATFNPLAVYKEKEIKKEKKIILEEINASKDNPDRYIYYLADKTLNPNHKISIPVIGFKKTVQNIGREELLNWWKKHYLSKNLKIAVAGFIPDNLKTKIGQFLPQKNDKLELNFPKYESPKKLRVKTYFKNIDQVKFRLNFEYLSKITPKEMISLELMQNILGGGGSSILFEELRTKRGLCYSVWAQSENYYDFSTFEICGGFDPKRMKETNRAIVDILNQIRKQGFDSKKFAEAKNNYLGSLEIKCDDTAELTYWPIFDIRQFNKVLSFKKTIEILNSINKNDLDELAKKLFDTRYAAATTLGPFRDEEFLSKSLDKLA